MKLKALDIFLGTRHIGVLFQHIRTDGQVVNRFVANDDFVRDPRQAILSLSYVAANPESQPAFWAGIASPLLNGVKSSDPARGWLLPAFFQNLLPEGPLRSRIAELRGCSPHDHFELLAATAKDWPGDVHGLPTNLTRDQLTEFVKENDMALELEISVVAAPMEEAYSLPGVQAKLAVLKEDKRFVDRTKHREGSSARHVIAKLPVAGYPHLPELEDLSLRMAAAAGVSVVEAELAPLNLLAVEHGYDLGDVDENAAFLAVFRYDRDARSPTGSVHCEDFAQILGVQPEAKYTLDYLTLAGIMLALPSVGEAGVHELLRRVLVNELMGNPDMHLKNIGVRYPDSRTPELAPAYDLVAYAAYGAAKSGRALRLAPPVSTATKLALDTMAPLNPVIVREFCARLGIPEKPAQTALKRCAAKAFETWPALINHSSITDKMKNRLLARLEKKHQH